MLITCEHCGQIWEFNDSALPKIKEAFRARPESRMNAELIKALNQATNLPMFISKNFAVHATKTDGHCFSCNAMLIDNSNFVKYCLNCKALNLDLRYA